METLSYLFDLQQQICYVQCCFCTTILGVSVPIRSLSSMVTVECGHCNGLLSVNMLMPLPFNLLAAFNQAPEEVPEEAQGGTTQTMDMGSTTVAPSNHDLEVEKEEEIEEDDDDDNNFCIVVHKPLEKKKRAPSAYNCFIKEELTRLKAVNPLMTHKEAFSTAAKNWARFPNSMPQKKNGDEKTVDTGHREFKR